MTNRTQSDILQRVVDRYWDTIPSIMTHIRGNIRVMGCEQYGITVEQFHLLRLIRKGINTVSELAEARVTSRPAVSQAMDVLVDKGLVTRDTDLDDRRFIKLALTSAGFELINAIFKRNRAWMSEKLSERTPAELQTILSAFDLLYDTFAGNQ